MGFSRQIHRECKIVLDGYTNSELTSLHPPGRTGSVIRPTSIVPPYLPRWIANRGKHMTNETDSVIDGLIVDELTHVLLCGHWISPFYFDGEFSVDARGQITELRQRCDEGPGTRTTWQEVQRDTQLWWALTEAIEREYKDKINEALRERAYERFVARPQKWGDAVPL